MAQLVGASPGKIETMDLNLISNPIAISVSLGSNLQKCHAGLSHPPRQILPQALASGQLQNE